MTIDSGIAALIGSAIGGIVSISTFILARRSEDRRQARLLGVEIGKAMYEHNLAIHKQQASVQGITPGLFPIAPYLLYGIRVMDIVSDPTLSPEDIGKRIDAVAESIQRTLPKQ